MKQNHLPKSAFVDPTGNNSTETKELIDSVLSLVLNHSATSSKQPPMPLSQQNHTVGIPTEGLPEDVLLKSLQEVLNHSMNPAHPGYIGHMDSIPTLMSSLGELVSSWINNNMLSIEMSPVLSQIEVDIIKQFAALFGFGPKAGGVLLSGGTLANLQALTVARNHTFPIMHEGLVGFRNRPVIMASQAAHTSLQKSAMILGLGTSAVIAVNTNDNSQMDPVDLEEQIKTALREGSRPFCVVATAGTTVTGNIDPLKEIADIAKRYGLWLHVDAAYGGALALSPKHRYKLDGIEQADSITFNPQKWLYIAKTCAMVIFKDQSILQSNFQISAPYMNENTQFVNLGEISVQGTRHAEILKLWLSLNHLGLKGYAQLIDESYKLTNYFNDQIRQRPYLEMASISDTNLCCFRGTPKNIPPGQTDQWNLQLQQYLLQTEQIFLSLPFYQGKRWLRAVLLNPSLSEETIDRLFTAIDNYLDTTP